MSRKPKVEAWAVLDGGCFLAGPSNSRSAVEKEARERWPVMAGPEWKATKFVPFDPDTARVLKEAAKFVERYKSVGAEDVNPAALVAAIERRQKALGRKR